MGEHGLKFRWVEWSAGRPTLWPAGVRRRRPAMILLIWLDDGVIIDSASVCSDLLAQGASVPDQMQRNTRFFRGEGINL